MLQKYLWERIFIPAKIYALLGQLPFRETVSMIFFIALLMFFFFSLVLRTDTDELRVMAKEMRTRISMLSTKLVKQLKRRDKHAYKLQRNFDVLTAILQAVSLKRREY